MKKGLLLNMFIIIVVVALSAVATWAYFTATNDTTATVSTATLGIGETWNFPLTIANILPGETLSQDVSIRNTGTRAQDFYFQMIGDAEGVNFCIPNQVVTIRVEDLDVGGNWYDGTICSLYPGQSSSIIVKLGEDVPAGAWKNLRVHITLVPTAGNAYMGASNTDTVHLIATQYNGPAPIPDLQNFPDMNPWPLDDNAPDDDPNYP